MNKPFAYLAEDYNHHGELQAPLWFWALLLWLCRGWWIIAVLEIIDPAHTLSIRDNTLFWAGALVVGVPAILMAFIYPLRRMQKVSRWGYALLLGCAWLMLCLTALEGYQALPAEQGLWLSLGCFDFALCISLSFSRRLRDVFWWSSV